MIDLHSHILPGLDDGSPDLETSLAMARAAIADGVHTMVATPHVNFDYPTTPAQMASAVGHLNVALARAEVALAVLPGAEVAVTKLDGVGDDLRHLTLGGGTTLLLECPYTTSVPFFEQQIRSLQREGFRVLLAHPERSPLFRSDPERLRRLVEDDALVVVNVGSLLGRLGEKSQEAGLAFLSQGLVHAVASDSHDTIKRPPGLRAAFLDVDDLLPGLAEQVDWYTRDAPAAIVSSKPLPDRPEPPARPARRRRFRLGRRA